MDIVLKLSSLSFPSPPEKMFGRRAPLIMEIGVGSGGFIEHLAGRRPDANVLGVDRAPQSIARSYRRLRDADRPFARLIKADARFVVRNVIRPGTLERVYVNFPDPWPRRRHRSRRLLQRSFQRLLAARLSPEGRVLVTTDHPGYFDFAVKSAEGLFRIELSEPPEEVTATKWARKGSTHYHATLAPIVPRASLADELPPNAAADERTPNAAADQRRPPGPAENAIDLELVDEMYHAVLEGELPELRSFEKLTFKHRHGVSVVLDAYRTFEADGLAFLVHVEEKHLSQEVIVEARPNENGCVVALKRFAEPLHTRGVGESVRCIAEWLEATGMTIIHRKY